MDASVSLASLLAAVFTALGLAKLLALPSMRERAAHVGFGVAAYRRIGALEVAGAVGLTLGHVSPLIGTAVALVLLLLLVGATAAHLRAGDGLKGATPALALAFVGVIVALTAGNL